MTKLKRTTYCGRVSRADAGKTVVLSGWVQRTRDLGGVVFVWLRDREGLVQLVFDEAECGPENFKLGGSLRGEYVVSVSGEVRMRAAEAVNDKMPNGDVEVVVKECQLLNKSETPPIYIDDNAKENELVRLKYRYLDLRRPSLQGRCGFAARSSLPSADIWTTSASPTWRRRSSPNPRRRARGTFWCRPGCTTANFTRCPSRRRSTSSF